MDNFYASLPAFDDFDMVADDSLYHSLPDDWVIGLSDVVRSTNAIEQGRYKAVNMAGASVISAVMNACPGLSFPFVFGGDGASLAVPPWAGAPMREALARTAVWVREELGLTLRVAALDVAQVRANDHDVRVARFAASAHVGYAMFSGGGMQWAEQRMKQGAFALEPAPAGVRPDLAGLSCRWAPVRARHGAIVSLVVEAGGKASQRLFAQVLERILDCLDGDGPPARPLPDAGPRFSLTREGLDFEARALARPFWRGLAKLRILGQMAVASVAQATGWKPGGLDLAHYRRILVRNADYRKYDDGLRMTVDISPGTERRLMQILQQAHAKDLIRYGIHRQDEAIMTCIVPSLKKDDHLHFIDGAGGGYACAARALKQAKIPNLIDSES